VTTLRFSWLTPKHTLVLTCRIWSF